MKRMSGGKIALIAIIALVVILVFPVMSSYNSMVSGRESVEAQMSNIDTQLQRRMDLIPNLVNTVKGYAAHESKIFKDVSDARARLAGASTTNEKIAADNQLSGALGRLIAIAENYPDLKANQQYTALMDELSGTENRISVARQDFNKVAQSFNRRVTVFPGVIVANMFGFEKYEYFKAKEGSGVPPTVDFTK